MGKGPTPERIKYLSSLPAIEAVRLLITGDFAFGEDQYLVHAICEGANVNCAEDEMWEIFDTAMDEETDPVTVLGRLAR